MQFSKLLNVKLSKNRFATVIRENSGSILRTIVYTIGHFIIAATCVSYFTGANFTDAITDAIVEPIINAMWYFVLDRYWVTKIKDNKNAVSNISS